MIKIKYLLVNLNVKTVLFFTVIATVAYFIFYKQIYLGYSTDLVPHITFYQHFIQGETNSYPGFYISILFFDVLGFSTSDAAIIALLMFTASIAFIIYYSLNKHLILNDYEKIILTATLLIISAIYLPFFNTPYLGQAVSNIWHNPTVIALKPFAYLSFLYFIGITEEGKSIKKYIIFVIMLLLSVLFKPNFILVFAPAVTIYLLIYHLKEFKLWLKMFLCVIPIIIMLIIQYLITFNNSTGAGIAFDPFAVWSLYTPNIFVSIILSIAFPLSLIVFNYKKTIANRYIILAWICVIIGFIQYAFLTETGSRMVDGNWSWGVQVCIPILFLFTLIEWYKWIKSGENSWGKVIVNIIFSLHLVSGGVYLFRILLGYSYI